MSDELTQRLRAARAHVCLRCKRPVERATFARHGMGWAVDVSCHGDRQSSLVTLSELENGVSRWFWFDGAEYGIPPQRIELHVYLHTDEEGPYAN